MAALLINQSFWNQKPLTVEPDSIHEHDHMFMGFNL